MNVIFDHAEDVARNAKTFWFQPEGRARYVAGQFTELYLPHENPDERGSKRWFTLSSSPTDEMLAITTEFTPERGSSYKQHLLALAPGTQLQLAEPMGDFVLPKDSAIPLVFVAAGMGITPVRSIIKYLHDTGEKRDIHLIYAVSHEDELAFLPLFEECSKKLGAKFTPIVKRPAGVWQGETGSLDAERILALAPNTDENLYYLSGPEIMVETLFKNLQHKEISKSRLITDYFHGYNQI